MLQIIQTAELIKCSKFKSKFPATKGAFCHMGLPHKFLPEIVSDVNYILMGLMDWHNANLVCIIQVISFKSKLLPTKLFVSGLFRLLNENNISI